MLLDMKNTVKVSKAQRKAWAIQQRAIDSAPVLTCSERFTRVVNAIMFADDDAIQREVVLLTRAARRLELLRGGK